MTAMRAIDRKLLRDLSGMKGQMTAIALVMACGLSMMIMARGLVVSLEETERTYYGTSRFADVFCGLKRAPLSLESALSSLPGIAAAETRVTGVLNLDIPGMKEPVDGMVFSLPEDRPQRLNLLHLKSGRLPGPGRRDEIAVSSGFAGAHGFLPGDELEGTVYGVRRRFRITGIAMSPEFIYETRAGEMLPDPRRFGVFWMNSGELSRVLGLEGAFNSLSVRLSPGADGEEVKAGIDRLLEPYGGLTAYDREDHPSAKLMRDEIRQLKGFSVAFPAVFLTVAAFMTSAALTRLVKLQRQQIAQLKAFGYSPFSVGAHFLKFALVPAAAATLLSLTLGMWAGRAFVSLYHRFFQLPYLQFIPDWAALAAGIGATASAVALGVLGAVRRAAALPPAEAMRPEPPADFSPSRLEKMGIHRLVPPSFRMALRNLERKPWQAVFTALGLALAAAIPVLPGAMADGVEYLMEFQWSLAQRQDATAALLEPGGPEAFTALARFPGVLSAEPFRAVPVVLRTGHRKWRTAVTGLPRNPELNRLLGRDGREMALPPAGLLMSEKLAEILGLAPGDEVTAEVREGRRPVVRTVLSGTVSDYAGVAVYMEIEALRKLLGEEGTVSGAYLAVDSLRWDDFLAEVKKTPGIASVASTAAVLENFRSTTAEMMGLSQAIYYVFSIIVSFGVIYNGARIALSERGRDLATLRVLGFTRREVSGILVSELALLTLAAVGPGLVLGRWLTEAVMESAGSETMRFPVIITGRTYVMAAATVLLSSLFSFAVVTRRIASLDLLGVLKSGE